MGSMLTRAGWLRAAMLATLVALSAEPAHAQSHVERRGPYILRSSSVATMNLAADSARRHGIERADGRAVLNVVVQKVGEGNRLDTVPAEVRAQVRTLAGVVQDIEMKEARENGYVAYSGGYAYLPREVMDILVTARPDGLSEPLKLSYRERIQGEP